MPPPSARRLVAGPPGREIPLVCPESRLPLHLIDGEVVALGADDSVVRRWALNHGFPDLILGGRFDDAADEACACYEVESNTYSTLNYWIPLFRRMFPDRAARPPRILAIGCGVGVEVELLCEAGFDCYGVDNGSRTQDWPRRRHPHGLLLANAMNLPFEDGTFDAVFCGCVFAHVGVIGDSKDLSPTGWEDRQRLANEMVRVTRHGGHVVACSPNRLFPFDIFHWRKPGSYAVTCNPPWSPFLLSVGDFRRLFRRAGANDVQALPVEGFWGFVTQRKTAKGRLLSLPIRVMFRLASLRAGSFLRSWPVVPWITVGCRA